MTTLLNPAPAGPVDADVATEMAQVVDILVPNEVEATTLTGLRCDDEDEVPQVARTLADRWKLQGCVITLGARGALVLDRFDGNETVTRIPPHRVRRRRHRRRRRRVLRVTGRRLAAGERCPPPRNWPTPPERCRPPRTAPRRTP